MRWNRTAEFRVVKGFAYCSNYQGFSILDVRDPRNMRSVFRYQNQPAPDNTQYIDIKGGDILVHKTDARLKMWDVSNPFSPVLLSTFAPPNILLSAPSASVGGSFGYHGLWIHEDRRGRFAFASCRMTGYTDQILLIVDITDPRNPREASRWHYPGMWTAAAKYRLGRPTLAVLANRHTCADA